MLLSSIYGGQVSILDFFYFVLMQSFVFKSIVLLNLILLYSVFGFGQDLTGVPLTKCWDYLTENMSDLGYASDNAKEIYLPLSNNSITSIDNLGNSLWTTDVGSEIISDLIYADERIYFVTKKEESNKDSKPYLNAISSRTGINLWKVQLQANSNQTPFQILSVPNFIIVSNSTDAIFFVEQTDGTLAKQIKINKEISSNLVTDNKSLYFFTEGRGIQRLSVNNEKESNLGSSGLKVNYISNLDNSAILVSTDSGQILFIDKTTEKRLWINRVGGTVNFSSQYLDSIFVSSYDNYLYRLSLKTGNIIWRRRFENRSLSDFLKDRGIIISSLINGTATTFTEVSKGKVINQINTVDNKFYVNKPLVLGERVILFQNSGLTAYEFGNCEKEKE